MEYENELSDFMYRRIQFLNIEVNFVFLGGLKRYWGGLKSNLQNLVGWVVAHQLLW